MQHNGSKMGWEEGREKQPVFHPAQIIHHSSVIHCYTDSENLSNLNTKWGKMITIPQTYRLHTQAVSLWQEGYAGILWIFSIICQMFRISFWVFNGIIGKWSQAEGGVSKKQNNLKSCVLVLSLTEVDVATVEAVSEYVYSSEEVGLNQSAQSYHTYFNSSYIFGKC